MLEMNTIRTVDIYLLDQVFKSRIHRGQRILDAGCGGGRNLKFLLEQNFDVIGIDPIDGCIDSLKQTFPDQVERFILSDIEQFNDQEGFDVIICNAVLHFAKNHAHFDVLMKKLVSLLRNHGVMFIRMTSDIGITDKLGEGEDGVYRIPDGSRRYLLTREKVDALMNVYNLKLLEPVKTVNVDEMRYMTTLVLIKNDE